MGGGYYDRQVYAASASRAGGYSEAANKVLSGNKELHKSLDPKRFASEKLQSDTKHPIIFALDVTGSMGDWTKIIYDKLPMFYGQIMMQKYLQEPSVSFCAIGDHTCDKAPLQVTEFGEGKEIDQLISKVWLEGGGGGGYIESYELAAYFYDKRTTMKGQEIPFFFVTGDQKFYDKVDKKTIKKLFGVDDQQNDSAFLWKELIKKCNVFHLHKPYSSSDADKEILQQWTKTLGSARILKMKTAKACIDVMLGAIAITSGVRNLETYIEDMKQRGQDEDRIKEVTEALHQYAEKSSKMAVKIGGGHAGAAVVAPAPAGEHEEEKKIEKDDEMDKVRKEVMDGLDKLDSWKESHVALLERKELRNKGVDIPKDFLCPITQEIFINPVMIDDGNTYEKDAIEVWLKNHNTSPITNSTLSSKDVMANLTLQRLIEQFMKDEK